MNAVVIYKTFQLVVRKKLFERYVDDIICIVEGDPNTLLNPNNVTRVNSLHKNIQFTTEKANEKEELAFSNMSFVVNHQKESHANGIENNLILKLF